MSLLIYNARLIDPATGRDEPGGLLIENGAIADLGAHLATPPQGTMEGLDAQGRCLAPGLVDLRVKTGEPGEEQRETLETAAHAAVSGGITSFVVMPDTDPVIDDVALIQFLTHPDPARVMTRVYAAGALTVGLAGTAMAEIGLMREAGAVMFTNGDQPVADPGVMKRAMAYAASHGALIASRPDTLALRGRGVMNSGAFAARLGLAGIPREAEWIGAMRDLTLAEATGCRLVLDQVSTARTLELVAESRARGATVACTVAAHHLTFNELDVGDYLTYCKVNPPFRGEADRQALIAGLAAGAVDAVVSAHDPQPPEAKRLPFAEAAFGAAGLETLLAAVIGLVQDGALDLATALRPLTCGPADLIGLPQGRLSPGAPADLILFDPDAPWKCEREAMRSRSTNSPFDGRLLTGRVKRTFIGGKTVFDSEAPI